MMDALGIGAVSRTTGVTIETIRWYEKVGLLQAPARTASNYRSYGQRHLDRLSFIRRARDLGFILGQVRDLLRLADQQDQSCEDIDVIAREHLGEVERKIADLQRLRRELADIIGRCGHGTVAECRILDALSPSPADAS